MKFNRDKCEVLYLGQKKKKRNIVAFAEDEKVVASEQDV